MSAFEKCLKERRLLKVEPSPEMVKKEMESAGYDLGSAVDSLEEEDNKWASIRAYYVMFHAAKALVLEKGYREKGHSCLLIALRELYPKEKTMADDLEMCMDLRHEADYASSYDAESAVIAVKKAEKFMDRASVILA